MAKNKKYRKKGYKYRLSGTQPLFYKSNRAPRIVRNPTRDIIGRTLPASPLPGPVAVDLGRRWLFEGGWVSVVSTNVDMINYNIKERWLFMRFWSGAVYLYYEVPPIVARDLYHASSMGRFQWRVIRARHYRYKQLVPPTNKRSYRSEKPFRSASRRQP